MILGDILGFVKCFHDVISIIQNIPVIDTNIMTDMAMNVLISFIMIPIRIPHVNDMSMQFTRISIVILRFVQSIE